MREQSKNWKNRIIIFALCAAMVFGNNFAAFASAVQEEETTVTILELETNDVVETATESGKDVFVRIGGEESILTKLVLAVQTADGSEQEITEGVVIKNVVTYHLDADEKLLNIEGNLDGQEFASDFQKLKKSETEDTGWFEAIPEVTGTPADSETPEATGTPAASETPEATETPAESEPPAAGETQEGTGTDDAAETPVPTVTPAESDNALSDPTLSTAKHGNLNQVVKDGKKYFIYDDGTRLTGWYQMMPTWKLYLDPADNGAAVVGYKKIDSKEYVFNKDGIVVEQYGTPMIDGKKYWIVGDGSLRTGWMVLGNMKLYFDPELKYALMGISKVGDKHYLFDKNGVLVALAGTPVYDGKKYWFQEDGALGSGWMVLTNWKMYFDPKTFEAAVGRKEVDNKKYLFDENGVCYTNSRTDLLDGKKYWFNTDGSLATGWLNLAGMQMYFHPDTWHAATGINTIDGKKYYFDENGVMQTGFRKMDGSTYYFQSDGSMMTGGGTPMIDGKKYYMESDGKLRMGWVQMTATWKLYFNPDDNGAAAVGFTKIDGSTYYFNQDGIMLSGFQTIAGKNYCFNADGVMYSGGTPMIDGKKYAFDGDGVQLFGWVYLGSSRMYFDKNSGGAALTGKQTIGGVEYEFDSNGILISGSGTNNAPPNEAEGGQKTIKNLLQNALKPAGSTLYIWGGGHDNADAMRYGINANWASFFNSQNSSYDYTKHRYEYGKGLDCSGFVGWAVYNTMYKKSGQNFLTTTSSKVAGYYANSKGWGDYYSSPSSFKSGDVVSMSGHTYIVLGECSDGSLVIVHSTPPGGVQIGGTVTPSGSSNSQAVQLARKYMKKYYPNWYFSTGSSGKSYFRNITLCRWKVDGSSVMSDPEGYQSMSAEQVLKNLYND